jgi:hypothetical protein
VGVSDWFDGVYRTFGVVWHRSSVKTDHANAGGGPKYLSAHKEGQCRVTMGEPANFAEVSVFSSVTDKLEI